MGSPQTGTGPQPGTAEVETGELGEKAGRSAPLEPLDVKLDTAHEPQVASGPRLGERHRALLVRLLRAAYPHPSFPDGPYERTAGTIIAAADDDALLAATLGPGLSSMDDAAGGDFLALDDDAACHLLRGIADATFFKAVRATAVVSLYDDHEVWELLGYEGASFDRGGYLHRGFDDLDWLPGPRIEEYDGPARVEVVTAGADQEGTA